MMREERLAEGWDQLDSVAVELRSTLPEEYVVLAEPTVHGRAMDALVVGPQGIFVLYARGWEGEIEPARWRYWRGRLDSGREVRYPSPVAETRSATRALRAFLRDEFPSLEPAIYHYLVLLSPEARLSRTEPMEPEPVTLLELAETIVNTGPYSQDLALDEETRVALARAFQERRLTASQRASEPFIFRSGGLFGSGKKVWTIRAAVRHMDRHPDDGMHHLRNDTLAQWLESEGAEHLAALARDVVHEGQGDRRAPLETFLIESGLVARPRLSVRPRQVHLGYVLSGDTADTRLQVGKGRGRGYLFGRLRAGDPWLSVEPREFSGGPVESVVSVSASTGALLISTAPYESHIEVESNGSAEPVSVPVRFRVVGMPSSLNRYLLRPLAGLVGAGVLGLGIGWWLARAGAPLPAQLGAFVSPGLFWPAVVGLVWGLLGALRGLRQPLAWPIGYATGRWLLRIVVWGAAMFALGMLGLWYWGRFLPGPGAASMPPGGWATIGGLAVALSILPATLAESWPRDPAHERVWASARRFAARPAMVVALSVLLIGMVIVSVPAAISVEQRFSVIQRAAAAQGWVATQSTRMEAALNDFTDELYLRYHDRRAPIRPTPVPSMPTVGPDADIAD